MKKIILVIFISAAICISSSAVYAGLEEEFQSSTDISIYKKGLKDMETALLIKNAAASIHNENMEILRKLDKIEERLSTLERTLKRSR